MSTQAAFMSRVHNPDVLSCISNLSNDEVFTPPSLVNQMLDDLERAWADSNDGEVIWSNPSVTFLDPCTKSGVFLREIVQRLIAGQEAQENDLSERVDRILRTQIFGIGITNLTALLARRSVYCSKFADGVHSVFKSSDTSAGNIWFEHTAHVWVDGRCKFCTAPKMIFDRGLDLENHAYRFIHGSAPDAILSDLFGENVNFDVVIGNPPYQMTGGAGGSSDSSIFQLFVEQAIRLNPRIVSMVIPSRWMAGGRGLGEFRKQMLESNHLSRLVDYPVSKEVFPGVEVKGGVCYFIWRSDETPTCRVTSIRDGSPSTSERDLDEFDVFVRDGRSAEILRKVLAFDETPVTEILTGDTPFGISTNFEGFHLVQDENDVVLHYVRKGSRGVGYVADDFIQKNRELIPKFKLYVPEAGSDGGQRIPDVVLGRPWIAGPGSVCTQTFLAFYVDSRSEAESLASYYATRFFRFLVSLRKITQHAMRHTYTWVPMQTWDRTWSDEELFTKYGLSEGEAEYISTVIKPMELGDG